MSVLNINQFYSKEKVRTNKDYELTPQSEWVYGEKEMILFARRYLAYWKEANGVTSKNLKALHKHIVSNSASANKCTCGKCTGLLDIESYYED